MCLFFRIFFLTILSISSNMLLAANLPVKERNSFLNSLEKDNLTEFSSKSAVFVINTENYSENSFAAGDLITNLNGVELVGEYQTIQNKMRRLANSSAFSGTVIRNGRKIKVRESEINDENKSFRYGLIPVSPLTIRTEQAKKEIESLISEIETTYVKYDVKQKKKLEETLEKWSSAMIKDTVLIETYFRILLEISAVFNDGHLGVFAKSLEDKMIYNFVKNGTLLFPLSILLENDRCFYKNQGNLLRIYSINGTPIDTIINKIKKMVPCESEHYVESEIEQKFWFYYYLLYGQTRYFLITGFDENENYSRKTMPGIFYSAILKKSMKKKYDFKILEDTAFLTINSFAYDYLSSYGYKNYLKRSFNKIRSRKIRKLVIDIHNNRGGSTEYAELLLRYLTTKPLYYWSRCIVKRSKLAEKCGYSFENAMKYGEVREYNRSPSESNEKQEAVYDGETILVVGKHCFSTSIDFAVAFKNAGLGKIVGENTAGIKTSSEAQVFYKLPMSRLAFMIPGKYYISSGNHFEDDGTLKPDIFLNISDQTELFQKLKDL